MPELTEDSKEAIMADLTATPLDKLAQRLREYAKHNEIQIAISLLLGDKVDAALISGANSALRLVADVLEARLAERDVTTTTE